MSELFSLITSIMKEEQLLLTMAKDYALVSKALEIDFPSTHALEEMEDYLSFELLRKVNTIYDQQEITNERLTQIMNTYSFKDDIGEIDESFLAVFNNQNGGIPAITSGKVIIKDNLAISQDILIAKI